MEKNTPKQLAPVNGTPFDYLRWRGDLTFARDGFNEVDNLVLCILSYINFRRIDAVHTKDPRRGAHPGPGRTPAHRQG